MADPELLVERQGPIATLILNRPGQRNALTISMLERLLHFLSTAAEDAALRVIVLRGAGRRAFSAGFDHSDLRKLRSQGILPSGPVDPFELALSALEACPLPTIAAIEGFAVGGGLTLAAACDIRVGGRSAKLGMPPARLGLLYSPSELRPFLALLGPGRTNLLFYTGRIFGAPEAYTFGLLDLLVSDDVLEEATTALAQEIAANSPLSIQGTKQAMRIMTRLRLEKDEALEINRLIQRVNTSKDLAEGLEAYASKRAPLFKGA